MAYKSKNLSIVISKIITSNPFFAVLLTNLLTLGEDSTIKTAQTDGKLVTINPEWFDTLTVDEGLFVIAHEVLHTIYLHPQRGVEWQKLGVGPDMKKFQFGRWAKAVDYVVNATLVESKTGSLPLGGLYHPDYTAQSSVEDIYNKLPEEDEEDDGQGEGQFDEHLPPQQGQQVSQAGVERAVAQAASAAKAQGKDIGSALQRIVGDILDPKVDWREVLHQFVIDTMGRDEVTWQRCNRRRLALPPHIPFPGPKGNRVGNLAIVIDMSGSVGGNEIKAMLSEVQGILQETPPENCQLFWTHTDVFQVDEVDEDTELHDLIPSGSGGTDMERGLTVAAETMPDLDAIVVLTDGYTHFSDEPPVNIPVLWAMTEDKEAPYGTNIQLDIGD